ncbi:hypothetical protein [Gemmatimonas groenlandica]|uniref:Uncharacterized protein n=1 Tax=Gemmatimonas groenlandica TaxID=2732249 RepID=A0A6M4ISU6_9BACT|nr:hypothetical protein [Gemmatimonas groenlandica]QJR37168.1 hypothetical protein HKW67_17420 [Gemmatimonas groenlandica]
MFDESELATTRARWQSQSAPALSLSSELLRTRTRQLDALMRRARAAVVGGGSLAVLACGWLLYTFPNPLQRLGGGLVLLAVALYIRQVWALVVSTQAATGPMSSTPSIVAYRALLETQRAFHGGGGAWARLLTMTVGLQLFLAGSAAIEGWDRDAVLFAALCLALPVGVFFNGREQARRYQREIDTLDQLHADAT